MLSSQTIWAFCFLSAAHTTDKTHHCLDHGTRVDYGLRQNGDVTRNICGGSHGGTHVDLDIAHSETILCCCYGYNGWSLSDRLKL